MEGYALVVNELPARDLIQCWCLNFLFVFVFVIGVACFDRLFQVDIFLAIVQYIQLPQKIC